jgi:hypothetical protein
MAQSAGGAYLDGARRSALGARRSALGAGPPAPRRQRERRCARCSTMAKHVGEDEFADLEVDIRETVRKALRL